MTNVAPIPIERGSRSAFETVVIDGHVSGR
jgi:hypothetical protein